MKLDKPSLMLLFFTVVSTQLFCQKNLDFFKIIPSDTPELFGKEIISDAYGNRDMALAPDHKEFFYTIQYKSGAFSAILFSKKIKGIWSKPEVAPFSGQYNDLEPAYSPDGSRLYFVSNRPIDSSNRAKDYDIWYVEKATGDRWSNPIRMDAPVNSSKNEFYPSITKSGSIYFTREMEGKDEDIVWCASHSGRYAEAVSLPDEINSKGAEFNAYVDPDETFVIFTAYKKTGNFGQGDLYISIKSQDGRWAPAKNLGHIINDKGLTYCPYVSSDRKFFFFTSARWTSPPFNEKQNIASLKKKLESPKNGWDNIYWIDAKSILTLK